MSTRQRVTTITIMAACLILAASIMGSARSASRAEVAVKEVQKTRVERGAYLVTVGGCNDCHTPFKMGDNGPEPDMSRMLSGHPADMTLPPPPQAAGPWLVSGAATFTAWSGPWGISYTANLTPDKETGLGTWTAQQFLDTIRNGRVQGHGRQLLPPMPWAWYRNMTDSDLRAVFAYLQTIPAVKNKVPDPIMAPPPAK